MGTRIGAACALCCMLMGPPLRAGDRPPDIVLATKGLTKAGITWLLQDDLSLPEGLRAMRAAKAQLEQYTVKRRRLEEQIKNAKAAAAQWEAQYEDVRQREDKATNGDAKIYNRLVASANTLQNNIFQAAAVIDTCTKELNSLSDPQDTYISALVDLSEKMEAAANAYKELAADADVQQALSKLSDTSHFKMRLGPSSQFAEQLPRVRKLREMILSAPVKLQHAGGGVEYLTVSLNGKATQLMILDSGAACVSITWEVARRAGATPGPDDPTRTMEVADGKTVEVKRVLLKTVQVGPFIARDVECLVFPESAKGAMCLLGDSFLRNFVFKVNMKSGELRLSQALDSPPAPKARTASGPTSSPAPDSPADNRWTVIFRSDDPARWNSATRESDAFAVPLDSVPHDIRYLRLRNFEGDSVIIPITADDLRKNAPHGKDKWGWEGRNYDRCKAHHLGVYVQAMPRARTGSIDITQVPGSGFTGYGFGNRVNKDDEQGFVWAGKPIERTVFEVSVTAADLTDAERQHLLGGETQ